MKDRTVATLFVWAACLIVETAGNPAQAPQVAEGLLTDTKTSGFERIELATSEDSSQTPKASSSQPANGEPLSTEPIRNRSLTQGVNLRPELDPILLTAAARISVPHVDRASQIEDYLPESPIGRDAEITGFRQRSPGDGVESTRETRVYLSYDDANLYVVFVCFDDPDRVRANMAKREEISKDDRVAVYLDTFLDRQRAYVFAANPLGIQEDGLIAEGQDDDFEFDTLWSSEGRLTEDGFVVWMAIPFKSLRFDGRPLQQWGIALQREITHTDEDTYWPYVTDRVDEFVGQFAVLEGLEGVSPGRNMQVVPYTTFARARVLEKKPAGYLIEQDFQAGADAKFVLRDAFALDVTANPDFSQVESDDPQVTVNKRFEVFFPEKRPFFLESATYFETPIQDLFFSRRIVDPQFGTRLTGRTGAWTIGGLVADDRAPGLLGDADEPEFGRNALNGVLRVRRELGRSHVGILATTRRVENVSSSDMVSFDTRLRLNSNWSFRGQAAGSYMDRFDEAGEPGSAYLARLGYSGRSLTLSTSYEDFSPEFDTELGAIERNDFRKASQYVSYRWWPESERLLSFGPSFTASANKNHEGRLEDWYLGGDFVFEFGGQTEVTLAHAEQYEFFLRGFRHRSSSVTVSSGYLSWLYLWAWVDVGSEINYSPPSGLDPFLANATDAAASISFRPTQRFLLEGTYLYSWLGVRDDPRSPTSTQTPSIFNNHLFRTKINYQFTKALSVRAILDYYTLLPNTELIDEVRYKRVRGDVLMTYLVNPWTAVHVGYTDQLENQMLDSLSQRVVRTNIPNVSTARQFFAKVSYLFQF